VVMVRVSSAAKRKGLKNGVTKRKIRERERERERERVKPFLI